VTAVLFTCAGQRVDIVGAFKRAGATAIAADANPLAPALYEADAHSLVPRIDDPGYLPALRALVQEHDVRLIVPLTDLDQVLLARSREELSGALVLLPDAETVERLEDKYLAHVLFEERGLASPPTWLPGNVPDDAAFPLLVRHDTVSARDTSIARPIARNSVSSSATHRSSRSCRRASPARSSRSTSSAISTAVVSTPFRGR
jgi:predicted ATP-grasp superfamily ATP-dependent carboligase